MQVQRSKEEPPADVATCRCHHQDPPSLVWAHRSPGLSWGRGLCPTDVLGTPGGCPSPRAELGTAAGRWHAAVPGVQAGKAQLTRRRGRGDFMPYPSIPLACQGQCFVPRFNRISSCSPAALIRSGGEGSLVRLSAGGNGLGAAGTGPGERPLLVGSPRGTLRLPCALDVLLDTEQGRGTITSCFSPGFPGLPLPTFSGLTAGILLPSPQHHWERGIPLPAL